MRPYQGNKRDPARLRQSPPSPFESAIGEISVDPALLQSGLLQRPRECTELGDGELLGARRRGDAGAFEPRLHRDPERLQTGSQHLAALAESSSGDAFKRRLRRRCERLGAGNDSDDARSHLGRRYKGAGRYIEQDARVGDPLHKYRKPAIGLAARLRDQALGDLALKHQGQAFVFPNPLQPGDQERGGNVVRQVCDDFAWLVRERRRVDFESVAGDELEATRMSGRELAEGRETTAIALDRNNPARADCEQCPRQTTGTGADLDDRGMVEPACRPGDPTRQVEVEEKILPEAPVRDDPVSRDDFPQRQ